VATKTPTFRLRLDNVLEKKKHNKTLYFMNGFVNFVNEAANSITNEKTIMYTGWCRMRKLTN